MTTGAGSPVDPQAAPLPRARGSVDITVAYRDGRSRLARLRHQGSAKCLLPRLPDRSAPEAVILNTAGGITGGDRFAWHAEAGPGAALSVTTQAAERIYRAAPGPTGRVDTRLVAGPGATLAWLPQETILFDGGALDRRLVADIAADARLLVLEALVLGRVAMGERVARGHLTDRWAIRRDGRLVFADAVALSGPVAEIAARPAVFGPHGAAASLLYAAPDAADRLAGVRAVLPATDDARAEAGASAWDGMLALRAVARDSQRLRRLIAAVVDALDVVPLPRVWSF
ncbi:MAG: urease accessory protein UreD [Pseudomonadota bacterium]